MRSEESIQVSRKITAKHETKSRGGVSAADLDPQLDDSLPDIEEEVEEPPCPARREAPRPSRAATSAELPEQLATGSAGKVRTGKYKGKTFEEVWEADPDYCEWAAKSATDGMLADLAEWALNVASHLPRPAGKRIYLDVPFSRKDFAKKLGARFDGVKKKWYAPDSSEAYSQLLAAFPEDR